MLETVPHREFQDLSIIYRWRIQMSSNELATGLITNEARNMLNNTVLRVYEKALSEQEDQGQGVEESEVP